MSDSLTEHVHIPTDKKTWLYGAALAAVMLAYLYFHNKSVGSSASAASQTATPVDTSNLGGGSLTPSASLPAASSSVTDGQTPSNLDWETEAVKFLTSKGIGGLQADAAIQKYLNGGVLNAQETTWVNEVISQFGIAPEGTNGAPTYTNPPAPGTTAPKPAPPPPHKSKTPAKPHTPVRKTGTSYVVVRGDTLSGIAMRFYGSATPFYINKLARANGISNPNHIVTGQRLVIPR